MKKRFLKVIEIHMYSISQFAMFHVRDRYKYIYIIFTGFRHRRYLIIIVLNEFFKSVMQLTS